MKLRTRLLLSYIVLIVVTLTIIALALLVFLNNRPAPRELTYRQLADFAQAHLRDLLGTVSVNTNRLLQLQRVTQRLQMFSDEEGIRTLLISLDSQTVLFDSSGVLDAGSTIALEFDEAPADLQFRPFLQTFLRSAEGVGIETQFGSFRDSDESEWLFFGVTRNREVALLFSDERPTNSLGSVLSVFRNELIRPLFQAALIGIGVSVVMAYGISRSTARPLQNIATAAAAVAHGDYDQRVPVAGPPEVRAVAASFNHMSAEVLAAQQTQRDFVANVSHDLKTPLTSIQGYSQAIMDGAADDPVKAASIIFEEAARLNRLVIELTDLARLQAGQLSMQMTMLDLNPIVNAVAQRLEIVAQKKSIRMSVQTSALAAVNGDGDRLAQVATNLISNAIKYTPPNGHVEVRTTVNNGGVEFTVQDSGIGIPAEDLPRIFERFYQVDKARGPRRGTGLGLAIVQEIVHAHNGTITVTSAGTGKGTTFTVWLPSPDLKAVTRSKS